jgi:hypothetical protein
MDASIEHCIRMITMEEQRAIAASSKATAAMHYQVIMLFRAELERLRRMSARQHPS